MSDTIERLTRLLDDMTRRYHDAHLEVKEARAMMLADALKQTELRDHLAAAQKRAEEAEASADVERKSYDTLCEEHAKVLRRAEDAENARDQVAHERDRLRADLAASEQVRSMNERTVTDLNNFLSAHFNIVTNPTRHGLDAMTLLDAQVGRLKRDLAAQRAAPVDARVVACIEAWRKCYPAHIPYDTHDPVFGESMRTLRALDGVELTAQQPDDLARKACEACEEYAKWCVRTNNRRDYIAHAGGAVWDIGAALAYARAVAGKGGGK